MKKTIGIVALLIVTGCNIINGQPINTARLDSLFNLLSIKDKAMGSVAISKNGQVVYTKAIGSSSINEHENFTVTPYTKYRIGSITKMFTATMIFQMVDEGKIKLKSKLDAYFPQLPNAKDITIADMLSHRSGLHNFTDDAAYTRWMVEPKTEAEMIDIIGKGKSDFPPGQKSSYSNSNYVVLGYVLEKIAGKPYKELLKERITSKIGLTNTAYGDKANIKNWDSYSYVYLKDWKQQPETDMSIPGGAGAIVSTPTDLVKFIDALFAAKLVSAASLKEMQNVKDGFGMGLFPMPFGTKKAFGHTGGIDGFESILTYFPEDKLSVAYCSNGSVYQPNDVMKGVLSICFNSPYNLPIFKNLMPKPEEMDQYIGNYSSPDLPMKIAVTKDSTMIYAQATGQSAFPLEMTDIHTFRFEPAGIIMEFNPGKETFTLKQGGKTYPYTKEKP